MINLNLKKGWNFVSFTTNDLNKIISNENIIEIKDLEFSWNRTIPSFFNTLKTIELNQGYIVKCSNDTILSLNDNNLNEITYNLKKGWNLIGWQKDIKFTELVLPINLIEIKSTSKSYNREIPSFFNTLDVFNIGTAYWVKMEESYEWKLVFNKTDVIIDFDNNLQEFNIKIKNTNEDTLAKITNINNFDISLEDQIIFLPGENNSKLRLENSKETNVDSNIFIPKIDNEVSFIFKTYNLPQKSYKFILDKEYILNIPEKINFDYSQSNYFENNNKPKLLIINYSGADNDLERFCYLDLIELSYLCQRNYENFDICVISLIDRSNYQSYNDDTSNWFDKNTFNITIDDKSFGIYICHSKTNNKIDNYQFGDVKLVLETIKNKYNNVSTNKNVFDLFLNLAFSNLQENEKNNPNIAILLNIWNHGNFYGICMDPEDFSKMLFMEEFHESIKKNLESHKIDIIDYINLDCCLTASLSNIKLFSDVTNYLMAGSTRLPGNGSEYNFILNKDTNIKNNFITQFYKSTVNSYKRYYKTLSVFNIRKFNYFEYFLKESFNKTEGIVNLKNKFNYLNSFETVYKDLKSLYSFIDEFKDDIINSNNLLHLYNKSIIVSSKNDRSIGIFKEPFFENGIKFDRQNNIEYLYNFMNRQLGKPIVNIKFDSVNENSYFLTTIDVEIIGKIKEEILLRLSNGFTYFSKFEIVSENSNIDIYYQSYGTYIRISNSNINTNTYKITVKTTSNVDIIYYDGIKYYPNKSKYINLEEISGDSFNIDNISDSIEFSLLNFNNIIKSRNTLEGEINIIQNNDVFNITGDILTDNNTVIAYGNLEKGYFYGIIDKEGDRLLMDKINVNTNLINIKINDIDFFLKEYQEIEDNIIVTVPVLYQDKVNSDPKIGSKLLDLEITKNLSSGLISTKLWNNYELVKSEVFSTTGLIYSLSLYFFDSNKLQSSIRINDMLFNYQIDKSIYYQLINKLDVIKNNDAIYLYFKSGDKNFIKKVSNNINKGILLNQDNFIDNIYNDYQLNNDPPVYDDYYWLDIPSNIRKAYEIFGWTERKWDDGEDVPELYNKDWYQLTSKEKNAAELIGYSRDNWEWYNYNFNNKFSLETNVILSDIEISLIGIKIFIPGNYSLIIGKNCKLTLDENSIIENNGNLIIQDNGQIINNGLLYNEYHSNIAISSGNRSLIASITNNKNLNNYGNLYVAGYGQFINNNYMINYDKIYLTSLNPTSINPSKSFAKFKNNGNITTNGNIYIYFGSELIHNNGYIEAEIIIKDFKNDSYFYQSKIIDNSPKIKLDFNIENFVYFQNSNQLINKSNIFLGIESYFSKIGYYYLNESPNLKINFEINDHIILRVINDSNYDSQGYDNKDNIILEVNSKNYKNFYEWKDYIFENKIIKSKNKIDYNISFIDKHDLTIDPPVKANDSLDIVINKYKFVESINSFNQTICLIATVDPWLIVDETIEKDNTSKILINLNK